MEKKPHYVDTALLIGVTTHSGQTDKGGLPYILHPIRVAAAVHTFPQKAAAFLHDSVEDGNITFDYLRQQGIPPDVVEAVDCLTRRIYDEGKITERKEHYFDMIRRIRPNEIARAVKIADLYDNLDPKRMVALSEEEVGRVKRYHRALRILHYLED